MSEDYIIGVDCGTQSVRAIAFNLEGEVITESQQKIPIDTPKPGWTEQDPQTWWDATCQVLKKISAEIGKKNILGVGISYQRESFVTLDKNGNQLRPAILWNDQRALREAEKMSEEFGSNVFRRTTGKPLDTLVAATKIKWMKENEKTEFDKITNILDTGGYIHWKLTGNMVSPMAGADTLGLLDINSRKWSENILDYLDQVQMT